MIYDERSQPKNAPDPAPSMMTIIPKSRWKTSYFFGVPSALNVGTQGISNLYVNIMSPNLMNINVSINGATPGSLSSLSRLGGFSNLSSNFPELKGGQYHINATSYHLYSTVPF